MATTIKIKRSTGTSAPSSLTAGELAYTGGAGAQGGAGSRLFVGNPADGSNLIIGGKYFTDMLDHVHGTNTASSALIVDSNKKINELLSGNIVVTGSSNTISTSSGTLTIAPTGNLIITHGGTIDLDAQANVMSIIDNNAASLDIKEGSTSYLKFVTTNSSEKIVVRQDTTFADDVSLLSDAAVLNFGADSEVNLTHVADTGLLLNSTSVFQFRDSALSIGSSADGQLDINADTLLEITAPTVQFDTDGQVVSFGADGDVTLTHAADASLTLAGSTAAQLIMSTGSILPKTDTDTSNTGSVTLNFQTNQNFVLTFTGNVTLANPSTETAGQSGVIVCIQDGTGSRTLSLGTDYETAGGAGRASGAGQEGRGARAQSSGIGGGS